MDKLASVHQRKSTKHTKTKKRPVKVVYISNPMKVKTSASEFRALVQELTGQDSELPDPTKFYDGVGGNPTAVDEMKMANDDHTLEVPQVDPNTSVAPVRSDLAYDPFDDVFTPQMLENFAGLLPANLFYEPPQVDMLRSLDAVQN
ncbi:hypothetical protein L1049_008978 [Liquidambar formosana]|uniref:VQ domain-containing protein n=1 Tax=Liquidambar formosana TaxID=63359 RepID=A0AAP0X9N8_LIQFO